MAEVKKTKALKKDLKFGSVYAIATGTTLSAGFFLLPGLAAEEAGATIVLAYLVAVLPLIPAIYSVIELSTAMPKAGGVYYFMDRALGPYFGTIGGLGTWLAIVLKVAFALIGMGAYISVFFPNLEITPVAIVLAILLGGLNLFGAKKSGGFQIFLVLILLFFLLIFVGGGLLEADFSDVKRVFDFEFDSLISTAALVYISYGGVTKVTSLSEEVYDPDRNLPRGILWAIFSAIIIYILGTFVMVSVIPIEDLAGNPTPVALAGELIFGEVGKIVLSIVALVAFISVANAGTMSASRYPLAMSRDHLVPRIFKTLTKDNIPAIAIIFTVFVIILLVVVFDPTKIAKLASAFQLLMYAIVCFGVIIMRESKIDSYDPGYKSPLYPWMQISGIFLPMYYISQMGWLPTVFSLGLIILGTVWYFAYAKNKVVRNGAIYHVFERLGQRRYQGLDSELRGILKEKGLRDEDPFEEIVMRSKIVDLHQEDVFESVVEKAGHYLQTVITETKEEIVKQFLDGTRIGATPVTRGVALPHFRSQHIIKPELMLFRCKAGIKIKTYDPISHEEEDEQTVNAIFFLVSPDNNPSQHLRILAQIAGKVDEDDFLNDFFEAKNEQETKESLIHDDKFVSISVKTDNSAGEMVGKTLSQIRFPEGVLVALLKRDSNIIIPKGSTEIIDGDRLTIMGDPKSLKEIRSKYFSSKSN